ncbi:serine/threonine-protein kinase ATR isoform X2 [Cylas formicarius]|uniref:serine/threonine-protein kinase ATR isoform X2 n=1 Tax=Cylas formicarius TaxID=197179 RepID=UPI002958924D|nr:serine/threonine-protein kinase ATR isoform X2 [Cylas formicarius]
MPSIILEEAFSMWKMFNEFVETLIKPGPIDRNMIQKLANMVMSKEFSKTFLYSKEPDLSFEEYNEILSKYQSFATWLLGQFFYLLTSDEKIVVDAQLCVLEQLAKTQLHIYGHLAKEYKKAFDSLVQFLKIPSESLMLEVFIPNKNKELDEKLNLKTKSVELLTRATCFDLLKKLLKILKFILVESVSFHILDITDYSVLDSLLYLCSNGYFHLEIFEIFISVTDRLNYHIDDWDPAFMEHIQSYFSITEQLVYNFYNGQVSNINKQKLEDLLVLFLNLPRTLQGTNLIQIQERLSVFLIKISLEIQNDRTICPCDAVQTVCVLNFMKPLYSLRKTFDDFIAPIIDLKNAVAFQCIKNILILELAGYFEQKNPHSVLNVYERGVSKTWNMFYNTLLGKLNNYCCNKKCQLDSILHFLKDITRALFEISLEFRKHHNTAYLPTFFNESVVLPQILAMLSEHWTKCNEILNTHHFLDLLINLIAVCNSKNLDLVYHLIACNLLVPTCYKSDSQLPEHFIGTVDRGKLKANLKIVYSHLLKGQALSKVDAISRLNHFFLIVSSGTISNLNYTQIEQIEVLHMKIMKQVCDNGDDVLCKALESVPHLMSLFSDTDRIISCILLPILMSSTKVQVLEKALSILPNVMCVSYSDYLKAITPKAVEIICAECKLEHGGDTILQIPFSKIKSDLSVIFSQILKCLMNFLINGISEVKIMALEALPYLCRHIGKIYTPEITKIWIELAGNCNSDVRNKVKEVIYRIVHCGQDNFATHERKDTMEIIFDVLMRLLKKSLQYSDYELQLSLILTIDELGAVDMDWIKLECLKILLYAVMVPSSIHYLIAINKCLKLSKKDDSGKMILYRQHPEELCERIIHLCYVNLYLVDYSFRDSLVRVSIMLGFDGVGDFVSKESIYLLPYLVVKSVKYSKVSSLISEMAQIMEVEISELLSRKYGNIFLHVFLGDMDKAQSKKCMLYLEKATALSGPKLRKMNIKVILNELLLRFNEKKEKVLTILNLLLQEDCGLNSASIPDYIQSNFLAFLLYFDLELSSDYSQKEKILQSLADLLQFLGPGRIAPLRFKIIAMLQTTHFNKYSSLVCKVWDTFVRNCEMEYLGPHLATIFISMLGLIEHNPTEVNHVLEYLIVHNENHLKENILDLFFISNSHIKPTVLAVINKHLKEVENYSLKQNITRYLKYLKHDTLEVRIQSLKQLRECLERNREELDQMILGYNGMDACIVELIDDLTIGCREKDLTLKLACGEIFGELGAIEPSHLPRRYIQEVNSFIFFITDDAFIESCLLELLKAFQTDKNARNTDRVALAIQEILKIYDISPTVTSSRHFLWKKFSESHRDVMTPLLSSKYICVEKSTVYPCPVYGTSGAASFQTWLYNWASCLIGVLPEQRKSLIQSCFPSMKLNKKILMHFLPYILLHSLIEGQGDDRAYLEFRTIINSYNTKTVDSKIFNNRPLRVPGLTPVIREIPADDDKQMQCTKVMFVLLDFLDRWIREWRWANGKSAGSDENYQTIDRFIKKFCKLELARCNYKCGEYPRALMYLEDYITANPIELSEHLFFLAEIYAQLNETDGVMGVEAFQQTEPSLEQRLLPLEVSGKLADATSIYEHMPRPLRLEHIRGLIQCYLDLDKVNTALYLAEGALDDQPEFGNMLIDMQAESLWRLGKYDELEGLLEDPNYESNKSWGIQVGRSLIHLKKGERPEFRAVLEAIKRQQVDAFAAASLEEGAYQHGYGYIVRLHCLNEIEQVEKALSELFLKPNDNNYIQGIMNKLTKEWQLRFKVVQESIRIVEPILSTRRTVLGLAKSVAETRVEHSVPYFDKLLGESWLQSVSIARMAGVHQRAYTYTLDAEKYAPPKLFLEKAKLHWLRDEHEEALLTLRRGLNIYISDGLSSQEMKEVVAALDLEKRKICGEAKLLIATYNDAICSVDVEMNLQQYRDALDLYKEWEKSLVSLAQYQDRILQSFTDEEKDVKANDLQLHIVNNFGKSLNFGTNYVYQSMPRLLSIWFDYGTRFLDITNTNVKTERKHVLVKMSMLIDTFLEKLPPYIFLTSFSQIISRISHPQAEVYKVLKSIIVKLMLHYPQQCLWMISSVIKSSYPMRAKRCAEILNDSRLRTTAMLKLFKDFTSLAEKLIDLCNKEIPPDVNSTTVSLLVKALPRMLSTKDFSQIMMPTHKFRKLILPNPDFQSSRHNPFPNQYAHIIGIEDKIGVLQSLQRPRKITMKGSDGKKYIFMLKPKDDLRKDFRLMEFNDIVNHLLLRDSEARQRRLNIRLYSVAPLNEECGLIEWIPDLLGLRPVLMNLYKQRGLGMTQKELKEACCKIRDPLSRKRDIFNKVLVKKHPPVLSDWFRKTFPDAQTWLMARTGYIRTTAVMSIAGYILGLGDRHGENILLDSTCGDVVHVDFNCLFNKGETFEWPERVPFRLTHNMVSAMGPLGVEGTFRKSCECTLRVLRSNRMTLMSIVKPFVYDPLVSWPSHVPASAHSSERVNEQALEHIKNIELRLQGNIKTRSHTMSQCLSVEGQTDHLITEAMNVDNLCQMYIGWGPYL